MNFDELIGQKLDGRYAIEALLGKGAYGPVFRATHLTLDAPVAVKVLHAMPTATDNPSARFKREARMLSRLRHPHIVEVIDFGRDQGVEYLVLEFITGIELSARLTQAGPLPWPEATRIGRQICLALAAAHEQGVVHRNLKPANVMLVDLPGASNHVKVLDFGIAKLVDPEAGAIDPGSYKTETGIAMGTPAYMAPEQWRGLDIDGRTDLYALGVLMWVMLTGKPPLDGSSIFEIIEKAVGVTPPRLEVPSDRPDPPEELRTVIASMLAKSLDDRPAHATDVAALFERLVAVAQTGRGPLSVPATLAPPAASSPTEGSAAPEAPQKIPTLETKRPGTARWALAALPILLAAVVVAAFSNRGGDGAESAVVVSEPTEQAAAPPPSVVLVEVSSDPVGAAIEFRGKELGVTPLATAVTASKADGSDMTNWRLSLPGHTPGTLEVVQSGPTLKLSLRLTRNTEPPAPPKPTTPPKRVVRKPPPASAAEARQSSKPPPASSPPPLGGSPSAPPAPGPKTDGSALEVDMDL